MNIVYLILLSIAVIYVLYKIRDIKGLIGFLVLFAICLVVFFVAPKYNWIPQFATILYAIGLIWWRFVTKFNSAAGADKR
jgi:prepilin signal peptidase PulO-like enzyme (type II secretory pathway)